MLQVRRGGPQPLCQTRRHALSLRAPLCKGSWHCADSQIQLNGVSAGPQLPLRAWGRGRGWAEPRVHLGPSLLHVCRLPGPSLRALPFQEGGASG